MAYGVVVAVIRSGGVPVFLSFFLGFYWLGFAVEADPFAIKKYILSRSLFVMFCYSATLAGISRRHTNFLSPLAARLC